MWRGSSWWLSGSAVACAVALAASVEGAAPPPVVGHSAVAADHPLASEAGAEMLRQGGNAVDAAVAAALAAGVVQPSGSGLGGGGFAVLAGPAVGEGGYVLDFREVAARAAHRDMYRDATGGVRRSASQKGGEAVAVPGEPRGLAELLERFGRLSARRVAAPAARLAARGFAAGAHLAASVARTEDPEIRRLFLRGGAPLAEGDWVRQPALAATLRRWAATGGRDLTEGEGARAMVREVENAGGVITAADLAEWAPRERKPLVGKYRGYTVITMPPPSSGGVALLQMLAALEVSDLRSVGHNSSGHLHRVAEAMKHAYADRAQHLGDPDFVDVPVERLLSTERIKAIQADFDDARTHEASHYGAKVEPPRDAGTQHISALDADGLGVALTTTINTSFGSGVVVESLGVILNNEMDDFAAAPGVPNAYGLVGNEANAIAPKKRPLSSMTPTILLDAEGRVAAVVGASGGPQIISSVLQVISAIVDFGMDPQEAVAAPRIHHQWQPDELVVEPGIPADVLRNLEARGHRVRVAKAYSAAQAIVRTGQRSSAASDPRKGGWPAVVR
jgi:gamma-glutamyltranspeptidase/glutathione hydrolase